MTLEFFKQTAIRLWGMDMMDESVIHYDPQRALHYASQISTPRLVGTEQEQAIGQQIVSCLESFGYQVEPQPFRFSDASS